MKPHSILCIAPTAYIDEFVAELTERNAEKALMIINSVWKNSEVKELPEAQQVLHGDFKIQMKRPRQKNEAVESGVMCGTFCKSSSQDVTFGFLFEQVLCENLLVISPKSSF